MPYTDSIDKIIVTYFAAVTTQPFKYKKIEYLPKKLVVSNLLLRGYTCPKGCGGCCPRFSLDYLPSEDHPERAIQRFIDFDDKKIPIYSDLQNDHDDHFCRNLNKSDGRCGIYLNRPFSCDFELIRFFTDEGQFRLSQQLFGRGWQFLRIDGERGALCEMTPPDSQSVNDVIRKLNRLIQWADHFGIETKVPLVIQWVNDLTNFKLGTPLKLEI